MRYVMVLTYKHRLIQLQNRGGGGKSGQGQSGPLGYTNVTSEMNIGIKVVMILLRVAPVNGVVGVMFLQNCCSNSSISTTSFPTFTDTITDRL